MFEVFFLFNVAHFFDGRSLLPLTANNTGGVCKGFLATSHLRNRLQSLEGSCHSLVSAVGSIWSRDVGGNFPSRAVKEAKEEK